MRIRRLVQICQVVRIGWLMQISQVALARSTFPVRQTLMALHNKSATPSEPEIQLLYFHRFAYVHMANQRRSQRSWQSWGVRDMEYFDRNPVAALKKPAKACRATRLTKEQWDEVLSHYQPDDPFDDFLVVMTETGCRPQEMRVMAARHLDLAAMKVRFKDGGIPGKKHAATWN
jgi:hypothetical protein